IKVDGTGQQDVPLRMTYTPAAPTGTTIIHAGQLWWGGSPVMKSNVDIIIKGNRIASIEPHQSNRPQTPGTTFVDASQQTVLPGLWDPHFHPLNVYQGSQFNQVWAAMFAYGFTSVQSVAGPVYASTEIREALDAGNLIGPRLFTSTPLPDGNRMSYAMSRAVRIERLAAQSPILLGGDRFNVLMPIPYVSNLLSMTPPTPAQIAAIKVATDDDARAIAAGALFAIGTDVPLNPPGVTNHSNLMALGLSMSN